MYLDTAGTVRPHTTLPPWRTVLAVVAHPDDESFGLGAVLSEFVEAGTSTSVLCFTHGEASTLHGRDGDLHELRATELASAARALGVRRATLLNHPDGQLLDQCRKDLAADVVDAARAVDADGLLAFDRDGVTGHPDHAAATAAALAAATILDLPLLGWTVPDDVADTLNRERGTRFTGAPANAIDYVIPVSRAWQRHAIAAHASQALPSSVLWRRLELLGDAEHLRVLRRPRRAGMPRLSSTLTDTPRGI